MQQAKSLAQLAEQAVVEQQALQYVTAALQVALAWTVEEADVPRKLATVRFIAQSLERHMDRLLALEEQDGYLQAVIESKPHLAPQVDRLKQDHEDLRDEIVRIMSEIKQVGELDSEALEASCAALHQFLLHLTDHDRRETDLLQVATLVEEGACD